jgi:serine protease AprX
VSPAAAADASAGWRAGFTGRGVDVAVVDTGVAALAPLRAHIVYGPDLSSDAHAPFARGRDGYGHGTYVASLAHAVAPDARIVSVKVGAADGTTSAARVVAGIRWVVTHAHDHGLDIRVLDLSLGIRPSAPASLDPVAAAAEDAWRHGIVVVAAAGNGGAAGLVAPAYAPELIAVGAADTRGTASAGDDSVAPYSAVARRGGRRPDLVAPGSHLLGLRAPGSLIDRAHPAARVGTRLFRGSGTSEAAAIVSGAAALVLERYPALSPTDVRSFLERGAVRLDAPAAAQGAGELRLSRLLRLVPARGPAPGRPGRRIPGPVVERIWSAGSWTGSSWTSAAWQGDVWLGSTWGLQ